MTPIVYDEVLLLSCFSQCGNPTLKHIPKALKVRVASMYTDLCENVLSNPQVVSGWVLLLLFPIVILRTLPINHPGYKMNSSARHREEVKLVTTRLNAWVNPMERDALFRTLLQVLPHHTQVRGGSSEVQNIKRAIRLMREDGQFGKAAKALSSGGVAPLDHNTIEQLRMLHPVSSLPDGVPTSDINRFNVTQEQLPAIIRSFPKGTGCGRSQLRAQHLQDILAARHPRFTGSFAAVLQLLADGAAPLVLSPFIAAAPLTPLLKKDGSIRPVAVGEVWRRIISKYALRAVMADISELLAPMQCGIGIPNAVEAILIGFNDLFNGQIAQARRVYDPGWGEVLSPNLYALLLDFTNAFNSVNRNVIFSEVQKWCPKILGWVQYTYGQAAYLFVGDTHFTCTTGVQQGDPLGPLLFALVLQVLLRSIHAQLSNMGGGEQQHIIAAYLDDTTVACSVQQAARAVHVAMTEGPPLGLHLSLPKSVLWSPFDGNISADAFPCICPVSYEHGVELLGGCINTLPGFAQAVATKRVVKLEQSLQVMLKIKDPHLMLLLLRGCMGMPKMNYCWRVMDPIAIHDVAVRCDGIITSALSNIVMGDCGKHLDSFSVSLATLPVALSGLGIPLPSDVLQYAHLSAHADTLALRTSMFGGTHHHTFTELALPRFVEQLHPAVRHSTHAKHFRLPLCLGNHSQKEFARVADMSKRCVLLEQHRCQLTAQHHYLLMSTAKALHDRRNTTMSLASQWLFALPNGAMGQSTDPAAYRAALQYRLLIAQIRVAKPCPRAGCTQTIDVYGYHSFSCQGTGNTLYARHNNVCKQICALANAAGLPTTYNAAAAHTPGYNPRTGGHCNFRPGDLFMPNENPPLLIDVTVVSPLAASRLGSAELRYPGLMAANAADKKHHYYDHAVSLDTKAFKAFAVDVAGFTDSDAVHLLRKIAGAYSVTHATAYSYALAIVLRRVSFVIMRELAQQLLSCSAPPLPPAVLGRGGPRTVQK